MNYIKNILLMEEILHHMDLGKLVQFLNLKLGDLRGNSLTKPPFRVTSAEVVIIFPHGESPCFDRIPYDFLYHIV